MGIAERMEDDWDVVAQLAAELHDAHARLVGQMTTVIEQDTWCGAGIRSPEHFLVLRAGLSRGQARAIVLLARRAAELPATARALREGRLSLDQAAVVARHTPPEFDETVAEFAQYATVPQLQRSVPRYDFTPVDTHPFDPSGPDDASDPEEPVGDAPLPPQEERARLSMWHGEDGRFHLAYEAPEEVGALVQAALAEAKDWLIQAGTPDVTFADALPVVANRSLESVTVSSRRARYRVNVFLGTDGGWLLGRPRLPQHVVDGLTCDGELVPVWETAGVPVSVGTGRRTVPERTRRLILERDRGCRYPGCPATGWLEIHHIRHWRYGGPTDYDNLIALCTFHHDEHHRNAFTITGDPTRLGALRFLTPGGWPIEPASPSTGRRDTAPGPRALRVVHPPESHPPESQPPDRPPDQSDRVTDQPDGLPDVRKRRHGKRYRGPTGEVLHLSLVDFTPPRRP
jgi:hypothetical protein